MDAIPDTLEEGFLYVSIKFTTAAHRCCCGCGSEVITPLSPADWRLTFDGESVSLHPSIGNWGLKCQSHYWIEGNRVQWARRWAKWEIDAVRANDRDSRDRYFNRAEARGPVESPFAEEPEPDDQPSEDEPRRRNL